MEPVKLLVADDHPIFLDGFCSSVKSKYPEIEIVAAVSNGKDAVKAHDTYLPDIVLMDIRMPVMNGVDAAYEIHKRRKDVKIIMLTTFNEKDLVKGALKAGAAGYILKETPLDDVISDIFSIYKGNVLIDESAANKLGWYDFDDAGDTGVTASPAHSGLDAVEPQALDSLTRREREIFYLILDGKTNTAIAAQLGISEGTVRNHVHRIYDILGVHNRTALVVWAFECGIR